MSWFKKLFREKSERASESDYGKRDLWSDKFDSFKSYRRDRLVPVGEEASEETVSYPGEVYAVTTARNFRGDTLDKFVFESDWVFLTKEQFLEPKFQQRLARSDNLTTLCKSLATQRTAKVSTVTAKPPLCHCNDISFEESSGRCERNHQNLFRRFVNAVATVWRRFCKRLKNCCKVCKMRKRFIRGDRLSEDSNFTLSYLCR